MACSKGITCLDNEIRIALVGKTGVGKSATGNTIIGRRQFTSSISGSSVTKSSEQCSFREEDRNWSLIDVPGFCDTHMPEHQIREEVAKCVALSHPGLHAILFVIKCGRYTEEDVKTLNVFIHCFGKEAIRYVSIIFTGGDDLEAEETTIEKFIQDSPPTLQYLTEMIDKRYLVVNNRGSEEEKSTFRENLLAAVQSIMKENGGRYYTNEMYQAAGEDLQKAQEQEMEKIKEERKIEDEEKIRKATVEIQSQLDDQEPDFEKKVKEKIEEVKATMEAERKEEAIRRTREHIAKRVGGAAAGTAMLFIGRKAFTLIGISIAGPVGGALALAASFAISYLGNEIAGHIRKTE